MGPSITSGSRPAAAVSQISSQSRSPRPVISLKLSHRMARRPGPTATGPAWSAAAGRRTGRLPAARCGGRTTGWPATACGPRRRPSMPGCPGSPAARLGSVSAGSGVPPSGTGVPAVPSARGRAGLAGCAGSVCPCSAGAGAVVHRGEQVLGAEEHAPAGAGGVRLRGEVVPVVAQHGQVLPVRREDLGDREPGGFPARRGCARARPARRGPGGAVRPRVRRMPQRGRDGQPRDRVRVAVELGQDRELVQGQLLVQALDRGPGLIGQPGGGQRAVDSWRWSGRSPCAAASWWRRPPARRTARRPLPAG